MQFNNEVKSRVLRTHHADSLSEDTFTSNSCNNIKIQQ